MMAQTTAEKRSTTAALGVGFILMAAMVLAVLAGFKTSHHTTSDFGLRREPPPMPQPDFDQHNKEAAPTPPKKAIQSLCDITPHKQTCIKSLSAATAATNATDPHQLIRVVFKVTKKAIVKALRKSSTVAATATDPRTTQAMQICREVVRYSADDLERSFKSMENVGKSSEKLTQFTEDLKVWIGGAMTYQEVCFDAFENTTGHAGEKMKDLLRTSRELTSNALRLVSRVGAAANIMGVPTTGGSARHVLTVGATVVQPAGEVPKWVSDERRKIMQVPKDEIKADAVVAKDGSGMYRTVAAAVAAVPVKNTAAFVIYVKEGVYEENVVAERSKSNVIFVGDGPTKTRIIGNKSFGDGYPTYKTSTIDILGDGFMARDIGFENSAGPHKHQAVAARVQGDYSIFYNCQFNGYQDTLYTVRSRQFYKSCAISGTIDFIFGDAVAIFQNCKLLIRKPIDNQQCTITAQGRTRPDGPGAIILQNCTITAQPDYYEVKSKNKAFLGRPWKPYSRTIVMMSYIDDVIAPEGWAPWASKLGWNTLYFVEYANRGPGATQQGRVKWAGIKKLSPTQADGFTLGKYFVSAHKWIKPTGVPFYDGLAAM